MKKLLFFLSILFSFSVVNGQIVTIGSGNSTDTLMPSLLSQNYSYSQQIYTVAEVEGASTICGISLFKTSNSTIYRYAKVYMGHTEQSQFNADNNWIPIN
ncbi:MAG TPA: hypothetical protein GX007_00330 [Bacteroidales bacterium]|jgi:hypothetical protein|nr:hypothetical protein [Bacteroidales bacterium]